MVSRIRGARRHELPELARGLAEAFQEDPVSKWLHSDPVKRTFRQEQFFRMQLAWALHVGEVDTTDELSGVAVWIPDGALQPIEYEWRMQELFEDDYFRTVVAQEAGESFYPDDLSCDFLVPIAAFRRGMGVGTALLQHHTALLDKAGRHGYLEASTTDSARLYDRLGFTALGEISIPNGPVEYPMLYEPRQAE